jgi:hypothetical protein
MKRLQCCTGILAAALLVGAPAWAQAQAPPAPAAPPAPTAPAAAPAPIPAPAQPAPARPRLPAAQQGQPPAAPPSPVTPLPAPRPLSPLRNTPSAFSLVLLVGEMQGTTSTDVPEAARKALDELKAFLPFKSYRLYDSGVIGAPAENYGATLRLRGQEVRGQASQLFEVTIARQQFLPTLDVALREVPAIQNIGSNAKTNSTAESWANSLMSASVRLRSGETVVVGTSRIKGDTALVLLITGLPSALGTPQAEPR